MSDSDPVPEDAVRRAADVLVHCYGAEALERAKALETSSVVRAFATAVRVELERRNQASGASTAE